MEKRDIASLSLEELKNQIKELELPQFRATQIYDWIHKKGVTEFSEMTNISKDLIAKLNDNSKFFKIKYETTNVTIAILIITGTKTPAILSTSLLIGAFELLASSTSLIILEIDVSSPTFKALIFR